MKHALLAGLALSIVLFPVASVAQIQTGQRVRVYRAGAADPVTGTLVILSTDTLRLVTTDGFADIAARGIRRLDVSQGLGHQGRRGATWGGGIGAVAGVLWGFVAHEDCREEDPFCFFPGPMAEMVMGGVLGAAAGAGIGFAIGSTWRGEQWRRASLTVALTPARARIALSF